MAVRDISLVLGGIICAVGITSTAAADELRQSTYSGGQCQIVGGAAKYFGGGVRVTDVGTSTGSKIECPIRRSTSTGSFVNSVRVFVVDSTNFGLATCRVSSYRRTIPGGPIEPISTEARSTVGSSANVRVLEFTQTMLFALGIPAVDAPLYLECTLKAQSGEVALMAYSAEVVD